MLAELLFPLAGGALIGLGASILLLVNGRISGISGMLGGLLAPARGEVAYRILFLSALVLVGAGAVVFAPHTIEASPRGLVTLTLSGLLVGVGTRLANGCTSGHGVCGLSRLSPVSVAATLTFMVSGVFTVTVFRLVFGAGR